MKNVKQYDIEWHPRGKLPRHSIDADLSSTWQIMVDNASKTADRQLINTIM